MNVMFRQIKHESHALRMNFNGIEEYVGSVFLCSSRPMLLFFACQTLLQTTDFAAEE